MGWRSEGGVRVGAGWYTQRAWLVLSYLNVQVQEKNGS